MTRLLPVLTLLFIVGSDLARAQTQARPPAASTAPAPQAAAAGDRAAVDHAIAAVLPSLVRLSVVYLDQQAGREVKGQLSGSGTISCTAVGVLTGQAQ